MFCLFLLLFVYFAFYSKYTTSRDTESPALRCGGRGDTDRPTGGGGVKPEQRLYRSIFTLKHIQRLINMKAGPCLRWSGARMLETSCRGKLICEYYINTH